MAQRAEIEKPTVWPAFAACAVAFVAGSMASASLALAVSWARTSGKLARLPDEAVRYVLSPSGFIASNALNAAVLFATAVLGARVGNGSVRPGAALRLGRSRASALGLASAVAGMIGLSLACGAATDLLHARGRSIMDVLAQALRSPTPLRFALGLVTIAAAPALAEESLFRGLLQTRLMARWGTRWGIVASSATFAAFHVDLVQGACAFVAGLFLGWTSVRLGGIRPTVLAHAINNCLFVALASFATTSATTPRADILALAAGTVLCLASIATLRTSASLGAGAGVLSEECGGP
jgi:membrane protease YdiL (CAAX protease family)